MAREMRHSGIEWIGQIPKEWEIIFLKNTAKGENCLFIDGDWIESPYITDSGYRYLTTGNVGPLKFKEQGNSYISANSFKLLNCTEVFPGDLLIARLNEPIARTCFVPDMGCPIVTAVDNVIYRPNTNLFFKGFMLYMLNCPGFTENANLLARGSTMHRLSRTMLGNMQIISPPLPEQQKIANYLDKVCGEVDEMIALQEQMIEELKAYKQSVITEAVTKGLNPDVPMKDSGIDWIGKVPEHWGTPAISYLAKITSGSTPDRNNPLFWGEGTVNWIKTGELQNNRLSCSEEKVTEYALNNTSIKLYPKDTILMAMYGQGKTRGMTALLDVPCTTNQACAALSIYNKNVNVLFLWKCLIGAYDAIRDKAVGTGQPNLNIDLISKFVIPLPPYNEQVEIVTFIDEIIPQIDSLIALKQAKIEELKDYKKSVIYEYVTGKKEVV